MASFRKWIDRFRTGVAHEPDWQRYKPELARIKSRRLQLQNEPDSSLTGRAVQMRGTDPPVPDTFALAGEAIARRLHLEPFDVQVIGALVMHDGKIAEMQTGEGKTLTAVMTVFANALSGAGAHVWTANDYLARRDAEWMRPAYELLGLSVGFVNESSIRDQRRDAYRCDVTYATANEVGFDYLRDGLALEPEDQVQRPYSFVLVDEVDSILIDEARIPLVIAGESAPPEDIAYRMARLVAGFHRNYDYMLDEFGRNVQLADRAVAKIESAFACGNLYEPRNYRLFTAAQDAAHAQALLRRDVDYIVRHDAIELVDEFKGRVAQSRRWPAGLQTALEAKEGLPLRKQGRILGSITLQNLIAPVSARMRHDRHGGNAGG